MFIKRALSLGLLVAVTSCAGVKGETYTGASKDKIISDVGSSNLSSDDKRLFVAAMMRSSFGSYDPSNKTVAQILDDQRKFEQAEAAREEAEKEAAAKAAAATAAERRAMQDALSVQVTSKGFEPADPMNGTFEDKITLGVQFHNRGKKKISETKGALIFTNHFGDRIYRVNIDESDFDGSALSPGAIYASTYTSSYNQFIDNQTRFRNTNLSAMHVQWLPIGISFGDGSNMTADDPDSKSESN